MIRSILAALTICAVPYMASAQSMADSLDTSPDNVRELYEQAEALRNAEGDPTSIERAVPLYERLVDAGHVVSHVRLARIYIDQGRGEEAHAILKRVATGDNGFARLVFARGHIDRSFGDLSDPAMGLATLEELAADGTDDFAMVILGDAYREGTVADRDPARALELYKRAAALGHGLGAYRLGEMYRKGDGIPVDLEAAIEAYESAIDAGYGRAYVALSDAYIDAGRPEEALSALKGGSSEGIYRAEIELAVANCERTFGASSDKSPGCARLAELAVEGDVTAGAIALRMEEERSTRIPGLDVATVVAKLSEAVDSGDRRATEALARYYRENARRVANSRQKHTALVEDYGDQMSDSQYLAELVYATYDPKRPISSRPKLSGLLSDAEGRSYISGFLAIRSVDRNAFVYALQDALRERGYYFGRSNGLMTKSTLKAAVRFCAREGGNHLCRHGPLYYDASRFMVEALARTRQADG